MAFLNTAATVHSWLSLGYSGSSPLPELLTPQTIPVVVRSGPVPSPGGSNASPGVAALVFECFRRRTPVSKAPNGTPTLASLTSQTILVVVRSGPAIEPQDSIAGPEEGGFGIHAFMSIIIMCIILIYIHSSMYCFIYIPGFYIYCVLYIFHALMYNIICIHLHRCIAFYILCFYISMFYIFTMISCIFHHVYIIICISSNSCIFRFYCRFSKIVSVKLSWFDLAYLTLPASASC